MKQNRNLARQWVEQTLEDADVRQRLRLVRWWEERGSRPPLRWLVRKPTLP